MNDKKRSSLILVSVILLSLPCSPALSASGAGSTSANFLKIGMGARAAGMGDAFTAVADDATAVYWNPAGLSLTRGLGLHTTHSAWMEGVHHEFLGFSHRIGRDGCVGASFTYLGTGIFKGSLETPEGEYGGEGFNTSAYDFAGTAAYSQRLGLWMPGPVFRKVLAGLKVNIIGQRAAEHTGYGLSFDLGLLYEAMRKKANIAVVATNVGTRIKAHGQPVVIKMGGSYKFHDLFLKKEGKRDRLTASLETDAHLDTGFKPDLGAEYVASLEKNEAALRVGYRFGYEIGGMTALTLGTGVGHQFDNCMANLNYAFAPYGDLGKTHRVSLDLMFGGKPLAPEALVNCPPQFTMGEGMLKISMNTKSEEPIERWTLTVSDPDDKVVRVFTGRGQPPTKALWDGKLERGRMVPEGDYFLRLEVMDAEGSIGLSPPKGFMAKTVKLVPYEYGFSFSGDLLFESGKADLLQRAHEAIDKAVSIILEKYPEAYVAVYGHTDNQRVSARLKFKDNQQLSLARAQAVKDYMVEAGADEQKLFVKGFGDTKPLKPNDKPENMAENRRVEMIVFGEKELTPQDIIGEGLALYSTGNYRAALERFLKALQADSSSAKAYRMAGRTYFQLQDEEKGYRAFKRALDLDPDDAQLKDWLTTYDKTKGTPPPPLELEMPGESAPLLAPARPTPTPVPAPPKAAKPAKKAAPAAKK